jgi:hypothetical protein
MPTSGDIAYKLAILIALRGGLRDWWRLLQLSSVRPVMHIMSRKKRVPSTVKISWLSPTRSMHAIAAIGCLLVQLRATSAKHSHLVGVDLLHFVPVLGLDFFRERLMGV